MESRQQNILTILLIIIIVIIAGIIGYLGFEVVNENVKEKEAGEITAEFDSIVPTISEEEWEDEYTDEEGQPVGENQGGDGLSLSGTGTYAGTGNGSSGNSSSSKRTNYSSSGTSTSSSTSVYINGNWVAGTISIPATGIKYSIFAEESKQALEKGVCLLWSMGGLNRVGNTVIVGHNYRNRLFFSKNKNLNIGDKIIINDYTGLEITYTIFNKMT